MIALPKPDYRGMPLEEALKNRRSIRRFSESRALSLSCLSQLLFAGQGVADSPFGPSFRTAPSAGATYPFDLYVVANNVEGLPPGLYRYEASHHSLISVKEGALGNLLAAAALDQKAVASAGATLVLAATFARTCARYGDRGRRYIAMEAGHISQNLYLQAASLGLGSVAVGAFDDVRVNQMLGLDGENTSAMYLHCIGFPEK